ncbi:MAG TPA: GSU2403 family nucleotidyltransferase fold protein [Planctomycetota bacterium]|nr:GSU2403 family nucleotidyltransferase fold protein [Planctomycetota bacterium]
MSDLVLVRALAELQPLRDALVVAGGAAHRLFPRHELGRMPAWELLTTEDVDVAARRELELAHADSTRVRDALQRAGFEERLVGAERAAHRYVLPGAEGYLEFLAPRVGSGRRRDGTPVGEFHFGGVVAQVLPDVALLLHAPWAALLADAVEVSVVNPIAYLCQKLVVLPERHPWSKRAKDLLYVYDTLAVFEARLPELVRRAPVLRPPLTPKQARRIAKVLDSHFTQITDDLREAARIAAAQRTAPPSPEQMARACSAALPGLVLP